MLSFEIRPLGMNHWTDVRSSFTSSSSRLSSDLKRFKALTWGKPLVMGRKTFESIGRALPGRETIVMTRDPAFAPSGVLVVHNLDAALDLAAERAHAVGVDEIIIGGGAEIYAQTIARAHHLFVTEVALDAEGEAAFSADRPAGVAGDQPRNRRARPA
jgi:dihydrofolate reductase